MAEEKCALLGNAGLVLDIQKENCSLVDLVSANLLESSTQSCCSNSLATDLRQCSRSTCSIAKSMPHLIPELHSVEVSGHACQSTPNTELTIAHGGLRTACQNNFLEIDSIKGCQKHRDCTKSETVCGQSSLASYCKEHGGSCRASCSHYRSMPNICRKMMSKLVKGNVEGKDACDPSCSESEPLHENCIDTEDRGRALEVNCDTTPGSLARQQQLCSMYHSLPRQQQEVSASAPAPGVVKVCSRGRVGDVSDFSSDTLICRICHGSGDEQLITPCHCRGSSRYVHESCLVTWFKKTVKKQCELCQSHVAIRKRNRKLSVWRKPEDSPVPLIWFAVFFVGLFLNVLSIYVNASELCRSTACLIFYVVNGFGIVLDAAFLWFWFLKCIFYWRKWCALNQDWFIETRRSLDHSSAGALTAQRAGDEVVVVQFVRGNVAV